MQPYFFPYIGYWQLINAVDKYVIYDDVAYIKGGWINRNNILLNGEKHLITLPLNASSSFKNINEIAITARDAVRRKILRKLESAYSKAPYYDVIMPMIEPLIMQEKLISDLNYKAIKKLNSYMDIGTEIVLSSDIKKNTSLRGQDKVIHISHLLGADVYINAIGGKTLYSRDSFQMEGIKLKFLEMDTIMYGQFKGRFVPNLSIIDVLMFNSVKEIKNMLKRCHFS